MREKAKGRSYSQRGEVTRPLSSSNKKAILRISLCCVVVYQSHMENCHPFGIY